MEFKQVAVCEICKAEIHVRGSFAFETLFRHIKSEHGIGFFEYYKINN